MLCLGNPSQVLVNTVIKEDRYCFQKVWTNVTDHSDVPYLVQLVVGVPLSMSNTETTLSQALQNHIKPIENSQWDSSIDAMQNYLTLVKHHAEKKSEIAQEKLEAHEEDLELLKQKRRKRRNYGTRTGIVMEDGSDNRFEI